MPEKVDLDGETNHKIAERIKDMRLSLGCSLRLDERELLMQAEKRLTRKE